MKFKLKDKIIGIVLIFSLAIPIFLLAGFIHVQKIRVRQEVKEQKEKGFGNKNLTLLKFGKQEIKRLNRKQSDEFEYNHQMYDVVKKKMKGDSVFYWCYADNKETKLNQLFVKIMAFARRSNNQNNETGKRLLVFFKSLYYSDTSDIKNYSFSVTNLYSPYKSELLTILNPPPVPPPESIV